jgi:alanyl-tRNA synthetase
MTTERMDLMDARCREFTARIVGRRQTPAGPAVALDRSAFYPEGGGQPGDRGTIDGVAVLDVQLDAGVVWHTLAVPLDSTDPVSGAIDGARRLDHMHQHCGQHLLSAAFEREFGLRTVSFHLGGSVVTIDLATTALERGQVHRVEDLVQQVISEARPIHARFVPAEELATITLRKPPTVAGPIRVVSIADFDHSACGGTHPRHTAEVGACLVRRWERRGDVVRVEFLCGGRAWAAVRRDHELVRRSAGRLSVAADELDAALERLVASEAAARTQASMALERALASEALVLRAAADPPWLVAQVLRGRPADELRTLARLIATSGGTALLLTDTPGPQLVTASGGAPHCGQLVRQVVAQFGGRGGGRAEAAQGGIGEVGELDAALALARTLALQMAAA